MDTKEEKKLFDFIIKSKAWTIKDIEKLKYPSISKAILLSLTSQVLTQHIIFNKTRVEEKLKGRENEDPFKLSYELNYSPFSIAKMINYSKLDDIKEKDFLFNSEKIQNSAKNANNFEKVVEEILIKRGIEYKTQETLTQQQKEKYGRAISTPDFEIKHSKYRWIDAKNFYGTDNLKFFWKKIREQIKKYPGEGILVFALGHRIGLNKVDNAIITDITTFEELF